MQINYLTLLSHIVYFVNLLKEKYYYLYFDLLENCINKPFKLEHNYRLKRIVKNYWS